MRYSFEDLLYDSIFSKKDSFDIVEMGSLTRGKDSSSRLLCMTNKYCQYLKEEIK